MGASIPTDSFNIMDADKKSRLAGIVTFKREKSLII